MIFVRSGSRRHKLGEGVSETLQRTLGFLLVFLLLSDLLLGWDLKFLLDLLLQLFHNLRVLLLRFDSKGLLRGIQRLSRRL